MGFARMQCTVAVDDVLWVLGFADGTPYGLEAGAFRWTLLL